VFVSIPLFNSLEFGKLFHKVLFNGNKSIHLPLNRTTQIRYQHEHVTLLITGFRSPVIHVVHYYTYVKKGLIVSFILRPRQTG